MKGTKRDWTEEALKARKILAKFIEAHPQATHTIDVFRLIDDYRYLEDTQLATAEKYIKATLKMADKQ